MLGTGRLQRHVALLQLDTQRSKMAIVATTTNKLSQSRL